MNLNQMTDPMGGVIIPANMTTMSNNGFHNFTGQAEKSGFAIIDYSD